MLPARMGLDDPTTKREADPIASAGIARAYVHEPVKKDGLQGTDS